MNEEDWIKLNTKYDMFGYTDARGIIAYDILLPLIEKAEKYDDMKPIWDKATDELMRSAYDLQQAQKKLEALKKLKDEYKEACSDTSKPYGFVLKHIVANLEKILRTSDTTAKKVEI